MTRFVAFDLEISKQLPSQEQNLLKHRPLGISCAATAESGCEKARTWYSREASGNPSSQVSRSDAVALVHYLMERAEAGDSIVTWNGLKFDFFGKALLDGFNGCSIRRLREDYLADFEGKNDNLLFFLQMLIITFRFCRGRAVLHGPSNRPGRFCL